MMELALSEEFSHLENTISTISAKLSLPPVVHSEVLMTTEIIELLIKGTRTYTEYMNRRFEQVGIPNTRVPVDLGIDKMTKEAQQKLRVSCMPMVLNEEDPFYNQLLTKTLASAPGKIVRIDSNFLHLTAAGYVEPAKPKSKRGRKPKTKPKTNRKKRGDQSSFNSQTTFMVRGQYTKAGKTYDNLYKIKVFRDGGVQIPGAREEGWDEITPLLEELSRFFTLAFDTQIIFKDLAPKMRNYKQWLLPVTANGKTRNRNTDIVSLKRCLEKRIAPLIRINLAAVVRYLQTHEFDLPSLIEYLRTAEDYIKAIRVHPDRLCTMISKLQIPEKKKALEEWADYLSKQGIFTDNAILDDIHAFVIEESVRDLQKPLVTGPDNLIQAIDSNNDKYKTVLITFYTRIVKKSGKGIVFKIFEKGKINIDGALDRTETEELCAYLHKVILDPANDIIYFDDEESYDPGDTDEESSEFELDLG